MQKESEKKIISWFSEANEKENLLLGEKGYAISKMYKSGLPIPQGFIVTTEAYKTFMKDSGIFNNLKTIVKETNMDDFSALKNSSKKIKDLIKNTKFPEKLKEEILEAYNILDTDKNKFLGAAEQVLDIIKNSHEPLFVSVRSSVSADSKDINSLTGKQKTFLNVKGNDDLINSIKEVFASLYCEESLSFILKKRILHEQTHIAVVIQKMVDSEKSGKFLSINPLENNSSIIEAVWGLGEGIDLSLINPDFYSINNNFEVTEKKIKDKKIALVRNSSGKTEIIPLNSEVSKREVLNNHEIIVLSQIVEKINNLFKTPQEIEFSIDKEGMNILQARSCKETEKNENMELTGNILHTGISVSPLIAKGPVKIIKEEKDLIKIKKGNIVIIDKIYDPLILLNTSGVILNNASGITSKISNMLRDENIPLIITDKKDYENFYDGQVITLDGFTGRIIEGEGVKKIIQIEKALSTKNLKLKLIIDAPEYSKKSAETEIEEIGLVKIENLIAKYEKHPIWYLKNRKSLEYTNLIYKELKNISIPFKKVWIRLSSIKNDEYKNLEGSPIKNEINPILGDYGIRFSLKNMDLLESEINAIKEISDEYENKKFGILIPNITSVNELRETKKVMEKIKLPKNVKTGIMIETPSSVMIIDDLCKEGIDFVNINIPEIAQKITLVDRDNENIKELYDEMHPAVLKSIVRVLNNCRKYNVETSAFGHLTNKNKLLRFFIEKNLKSLCVNPGEAYKISEIINEIEKEIPKSSIVDEKPQAVGNINTEKKFINEEDLILKALEGEEIIDEYNPGMQKQEEIPELNESIPIDSTSFEQNQETQEVFEIEIGEPYFENQQENTLKKEIKKTLTNSNNQKDSSTYEEKFQDIFG